MDQLFLMGQKADNSDHKLRSNLILSMVVVTPSNNVFGKILSLYFIKNKTLNAYNLSHFSIKHSHQDDRSAPQWCNYGWLFLSLFEPKYLLIEHFQKEDMEQDKIVSVFTGDCFNSAWSPPLCCSLNLKYP